MCQEKRFNKYIFFFVTENNAVIFCKKRIKKLNLQCPLIYVLFRQGMQSLVIYILKNDTFF